LQVAVGRTFISVFLLYALWITSADAELIGYSQETWKPDDQKIAAADKAAMQLPQLPNYPPLKTYSRYYVGTFDSAGRRIINGVLLAPRLVPRWKTTWERLRVPKLVPIPGLSASIFRVMDTRLLPVQPDGGCEEDVVIYDVEKARISEAVCHGILPPRQPVPSLPPFVSPKN
jgi:hypothetical protein